MARPLAALERFFERLLERPAARLFHASLEPVQLERRAERAMEAGRRMGPGRTYVPNRYRIRLNPRDLEGFAGYQATLEGEIADALLERARRRGYTLPEEPRVSLHADQGVPRGDVEVEAELLDPLALRPAPAGFRRLAEDGASSVAEATAVFEVVADRGPEAVLLVEAPGRQPWRVRLGGGSLRIGRDPTNDLVLPDGRVSRHHGQVRVRQGSLVYTDLGSTNGSFVNGRPVSEIVLGPGDVIRLGGSTVVVEAPATDAREA
jgi:hypothetical protein